MRIVLASYLVRGASTIAIMVPVRRGSGLAADEAEGAGPADRLVPAVHAEPLVQA